jgi:predicted kinase
MNSYVIVNGLPGSGKSTLAVPLAKRLELPLIGKDVIKDVLFENLGVGKNWNSRAFGNASIALMYRIAVDCPGAVLDSFFSRKYAKKDLANLDGAIVEVFCHCPVELAKMRYRERSAFRHAGHNETDLDVAFDSWIADGDDKPLAIFPVIDVDTTSPADIEDVARRIGRLASPYRYATR